MSKVTVAFKPDVEIVAEPPLGAETCCQVAAAELVSVSCLDVVFVVLSAASLVEPDVMVSESLTVTF